MQFKRIQSPAFYNAQQEKKKEIKVFKLEYFYSFSWKFGGKLEKLLKSYNCEND